MQDARCSTAEYHRGSIEHQQIPLELALISRTFECNVTQRRPRGSSNAAVNQSTNDIGFKASVKCVYKDAVCSITGGDRPPPAC